MLFFFIISFFSFIFFYNSFHSKQLPHWASEITLISPFFLKDLSFFSITNFIKASLVTYKMSFENKLSSRSKVANSDEDYDKCSNSHMCLLDLPDLVLETILEKLSPEGLCEMSNVCSSLRDRCMSDHLWEKHMKRKWGKVIGAAAYRHWQCDVISRKESNSENQINENGLMSYLASILPLALVRSSFGSSEEDAKRKTCPPIDSIMSWYLAIDSGKFWFPAQVYNRENGHVGFMLSCYDAEICYDSKTDTFQARYLPHGRRAVAIETGVTWDRIRAPPVDTAAHDLHQSDCLSELRPGDHVEIQWRRNKEYPYGWWYGIVGHLETCDGNTVYCRCHQSEIAVLEFNQYAPGSRWRTTNISRKNHKEEGNEGDGFYGGIRKLCSNEEISIWKQLWPVDTLE